MDAEEEAKKFKTLLWAVCFFLVSVCFSWVELRYAIWGEQGEATVTQVREVTSLAEKGVSRRALQVETTLTDSRGETRQDKLHYPLEAGIQPGQQVTLDYIPGLAKYSRPDGQKYYGALLMFGISVTVLLGAIIWLARVANSPIPTTRRRSRRP